MRVVLDLTEEEIDKLDEVLSSHEDLNIDLNFGCQSDKLVDLQRKVSKAITEAKQYQGQTIGWLNLNESSSK